MNNLRMSCNLAMVSIFCLFLHESLIYKVRTMILAIGYLVAELTSRAPYPTPFSASPLQASK